MEKGFQPLPPCPPTTHFATGGLRATGAKVLVNLPPKGGKRNSGFRIEPELTLRGETSVVSKNQTQSLELAEVLCGGREGFVTLKILHRARRKMRLALGPGSVSIPPVLTCLPLSLMLGLWGFC